MIADTDIRRLIERAPTEHPVLSLFLDMSVNSENKRTYSVFLNKQKSRFAELASDRDRHHREPLGAALQRAARWIDDEFREANRGVAIFVEIGGDWMYGFQTPLPVKNRLQIAERPVIGPIAELLADQARHGMILVDREHLRLLSVAMGNVLREHVVRPQPYPAAHDVQAGGLSAKDIQKRKADEVHHFFKEFAAEVAEFDRRETPDHYLLLGTNENIQRFREYLSAELTAKVVHTAQAPVDAPTTHLLERVVDVLNHLRITDRTAALDVLRDRVAQRHFAVAGLSETLEHLQEGKVERLIIARDLERQGAQCTGCGFYFDRSNSACPYCGGALRDDVDLVESMIRMAAQQDVRMDFVPAAGVADLEGVGALLRF